MSLLSQCPAVFFDHTRISDTGIDLRRLRRSVPEPLLQSQFVHSTFKQTSCMSVAQGMGRDPGGADTQTLAMACKQFDQGVITQRFTAPFPVTPHQKDVRTLTLRRSFIHHIVTDRVERFWLEQVNCSLCSRFRSRSLRVVCPVSDKHTLFPILEVIQVQRQHLAWPKAPMEHQEQHGPVSFTGERREELVEMIVIHWAWKALNGFHSNCSPDGPLATHASHEWSVTAGNPGQSEIIYLLDGILPLRELPCEDQVLVKRGDSSKDAINGRWRQASRGTTFLRRSRENKAKPANLFPVRNTVEVLEEQQGVRWNKLLIGEMVLFEKSHEVQQIESVGREGVGRAPTSSEVPHEARDGENGLLVLIKQLKRDIIDTTQLDTLDSQWSRRPARYLAARFQPPLPEPCLHLSMHTALRCYSVFS
jgi:hypothetical protein